MNSTFRIVPPTPSKSASVQETANTFGLHDNLQYGPRSISAEVNTQSDLRNRLQNWDETQDNVKLNMLRNAQGLHAPMRVLMERKIVSRNPHMPSLPQSNLHLDILMGRDETIEPSDIFDMCDTKQPLDIHADMEKKSRM